MIKVNPKGINHIESKDRFCLGVSIGSLNHEDERLSAIVEWINQFGFKEGVIDLSDALYRYTYISHGMPQDKAMSKAIQDGGNWLERNNKIISQLNPSVQIIRWNYWLQKPEFFEHMKYFLSLYEKDKYFRDAIDGDIERFHTRKYGTSLGVSNTLAHAQSVNYFCEELSAHSMLLSEYPSVVIYPGRQLDSYNVIRKGVVSGMSNSIKNSPYVRLCLYEAPAQDRRISMPEFTAL